MNISEPQRTFFVVVLLIIGTAAFFAIDAITPRGVLDGAGYAILLTLCLWLRPRSVVAIYASVATVLVLGAAFIASPGDGISFEGSLLNRATAIATIWVMAFLVAKRARLERRLRASEEMATAASQAKSTFLANMSHELRTPLNSIIGFSELIGRGEPGFPIPPRHVEFANLIHDSATHLSALIGDLLDITKIEANKYRLDEEEISLRDVAQEAIHMVSVAAAHAGLEINENIDPALPLLRADRRVTKQMLLNLLSNAVKFTPAGGKVAVSATVSASGLCVVVSDTGIGISRTDLPKLAQPFVQVENHLARSKGGTGLGLALCRQFAELHAGYLELESQLEIGTTARIVFPAARIVAA